MGRRGISYDNKLEAVEKYERGEGCHDSMRIIWVKTADNNW